MVITAWRGVVYDLGDGWGWKWARTPSPSICGPTGLLGAAQCSTRPAGASPEAPG